MKKKAVFLAVITMFCCMFVFSGCAVPVDEEPAVPKKIHLFSIVGYPGRVFMITLHTANPFLDPSYTYTAVGKVITPNPHDGTRLFQLKTDATFTTDWTGSGSYYVVLWQFKNQTDFDNLETEKVYIFTNGHEPKPDFSDVPKYTINKEVSNMAIALHTPDTSKQWGDFYDVTEEL